ncbi:MAG: DUF1759 domain-containing protein [Gammaproteobacteria bacterium]|nr:DUF1759 domain-containing protein [Gammaproteobacteria bacterium]
MEDVENRRKERREEADLQKQRDEVELQKRREDWEHEMALQLSAQKHAEAMALSSPQVATGTSSDLNSNCKSNSTCSIKLPKLQTKYFYGDHFKWHEFWDCFSVSVHKNTQLSIIDKFQHLISLIKGDAEKVIAGIPLAEIHYEQAIRALQERYGDTAIIQKAHFAQIFSLSRVTKDIQQIRSFYDELERHLRGLEAMGQDLSKDTILLSFLENQLPNEVTNYMIDWKDTEDWNLDIFRRMLQRYLKTRERMGAMRFPSLHIGGGSPASGRSMDSEKEKRPSVLRSSSYAGQSAPQQNSSTQTWNPNPSEGTEKVKVIKCVFCQEDGHYSDQCSEYPDLASRKERSKNLCSLCLRKHPEGRYNCPAKTYNWTCNYCKKKGHNRALCPETFSVVLKAATHAVMVSDDNIPGSTQIATSLAERKEVSSHAQRIVSSNASSSNPLNFNVQFRTALTKVANHKSNDGNWKNLSKEIRVVLDTASDRSYISKTLAQQMNLPPIEEVTLLVFTFGGKGPRQMPATIVEVEIRIQDGTFMKIPVYAVPIVMDPIYRFPVNIEELKLKMDGMKNLADIIPSNVERVPVDLLIGNDFYEEFMLPGGRIELDDGFFALPSKFGLILAGRIPNLLATDVVQERFVNQAVVSSQILPFKKSTEAWNNIRQDATDTYFFDSSEFPGETKLEDKNFWDLELIGITSPDEKSDDDWAQKHFQETVKIESKRWMTTWPWKDENPNLPTNEALALNRLVSLLKRHGDDLEFMKKYNNIIMEQLDRGIIEKIERSPEEERGRLVHYIPHHGVLTPLKETTKLRIVFDASAKTRKSNLSLNECLYRGDVMLPDLIGLIMRFRLKKLGIIADIEKAFLMVGLQNPDRDVTRFFWVKDIEKPTVVDNLQTYRFCRVPFGVISSPHLLAATINHHLIQTNTITAQSIQHQFYVDNLIFGAGSIDEAKSLYTEAKGIMAQASMNLREWACGEKEVMQFIPEIDRAKGPVIKVLGLPWNIDMDTISITGSEQLEDTEIHSKRDMLKQIAKVYDPLGYCAPVTVALKILWQDLWKQKKKWDDPLDQATIDNWKQLTLGIRKLSSYQMPRYIGFPDPTISVNYQLHCFTDASEKAYCAAVYLKMFTDSRSKVELVFSKVRLAPSGKSLKSLSIPRLELMGVLIGVRSLIFVKELLKLPLEDMILWTDSKCILDWIRGEKQLPVFEHNRVKEITSHRDQIEFRYVCTKYNPADLATRGMLVEDFIGQKRWIQGPEWLEGDSSQWPVTSIPMVPLQTEEEYKELKRPEIVPFHTMATNFISGEGPAVGIPPAGIPIEKFSSMKKLLRVTSWWLKYARKLKERVAQRKGGIPKSKNFLPVVSAGEICRARVLWDRYVQNQSFQSVFDQLKDGKIKSGLVKDLNLKLDENCLLRCYGRYSNVELPDTSRFPILMPKIHPYTRLLIMDSHHKTFHSWTTRTLVEIRKDYWIPQGRQMVQAVLKSCKVCLKQVGGPYQVPLMPAWPKERVSRSPPYSYVGIDYLGPLRIKDRRGREEESRKIWICLFTCMATRAIHLEVVHDMTANQFLDAVRRFVAYKGTPKQIISDNASQFKLVNKVFDREWRGPPNENNEVQSYLADWKIGWKFIPEIAPWIGGFYERMVVK